jgi:shikimate 5-dehydrogenase
MPAIHGAKTAVGGKGGVSKTTVCAISSQLFAEVTEVLRRVEGRLTELIANSNNRDS